MSTPPSDPNPYGQDNPYGQQPPSYGGQQQGWGQAPAYGQQQPYGQEPWSGQAGYQAGWGGGTQRNNLGTWALVLGILGFCCGPAGIGGIILGRQSQQAAARGEANNGGLGTAGFILGCITVALWVISLILGATGVIDYDLNFTTSR